MSIVRTDYSQFVLAKDGRVSQLETTKNGISEGKKPSSQKEKKPSSPKEKKIDQSYKKRQTNEFLYIEFILAS